MTEPRVYHYVKGSDLTRLPRRHIVMHCGTRSARTGWGHERTWRNAAAWFINAPKGRQAKEHSASFGDPCALWDAITLHCGRGSRTVLWAHNMGYQARVSECFTILPRLGWELVAHNMATRGCWLVWRKDNATLAMTDIGSIWPTTIPEIGKMFGLAQPPVPDNVDADTVWRVYCEINVSILRTAITAYLNWIAEAGLGSWQMTGAGQSWSAFRANHMTHQMLVHGDMDAMEAERRAMWTGRCEAYWHGTNLKQVLHEWDLPAAYARVARDARVPVRLIGRIPPHQDIQSYVDDPAYAVLAEVTVQTDVPTVPARHDDHILWPVGTFDTVLWDVEISEAIADGATVTYGRAWLYKTEPALKAWAEWILRALDAPDAEVPAWQKAILKHWSRALIGRFAMKYTSWDDFATMSTMDAERRTVVDLDQAREYDIMQVGGKVFVEDGEEEWRNSMPAITGYVMALSRVRLWRILKRLPKGAALYVDTDSILATDLWTRQIEEMARESESHGLRLKKSWTGFTIDGPRQIVTGDRVRVGGIPVRAVRTARHTFEGEVFESLDVALRSSRQGVVRAVDRKWTTTGRDRRRVGPSVGWTHPHRLGLASE